MITVRYKTFVDLGLSNSGINIPPVLPRRSVTTQISNLAPHDFR